jgi:hypothetical protein
VSVGRQLGTARLPGAVAGAGASLGVGSVALLSGPKNEPTAVTREMNSLRTGDWSILW